MRSTTDTTPSGGRRKRLTRSQALQDVEAAVCDMEEARARLVAAVACAWGDHKIPLTEIADAAKYNRERMRSLIYEATRR